MRKTEIQIWPIARCLPYARTLRRNDDAVDRMVAAFKEFRLMLPLLVRSEGEIVDGHLRLKAARKLQLTEVPVILCDDWTPAQVKAFRLLVNRSATWAQWDWKGVAAEFADLQILNFDLPLTGFDGAEIDKLLLRFRDPDSDALIPPPDRVPVSVPQDLWICGEHRILCGDATSASDVGRLFGQYRPELMVTDPPYGVDYDPAWREEAGLGRQRQTGRVCHDDRIDWSEACQLRRHRRYHSKCDRDRRPRRQFPNSFDRPGGTTFDSLRSRPDARISARAAPPLKFRVVPADRGYRIV